MHITADSLLPTSAIKHTNTPASPKRATHTKKSIMAFLFPFDILAILLTIEGPCLLEVLLDTSQPFAGLAYQTF